MIPSMVINIKYKKYRVRDSSISGLACLGMVLSSSRLGVQYEDFMANQKDYGDSLSLSDLMDISKSMGATLRPVKCPLAKLQSLRQPNILYWNETSFSLMIGFSRKKFKIFDPLIGFREYGYLQMIPRYSGIAADFSID